MAWNRIQSVSGNNGSGTTLGVTFTTANLSAGTKLIAYCMVDGGATLSTVKDGAGNTFASMASKAAGDGSTLTILELDTPAGDVGTKPTITLTVTGTNGGIAMLVQEVAGLVRGTTAAVVLDGTASTATGTFVSVSTGSATLTSYATHVPGEYLVAVYGDNGDTNGSSQTTPTGYTADTNNVHTNTNADLGVFYRGSSGATEAPASIAVTALNNAATYEWDTIFVAFRLAPAWNLAQPAQARLPQQHPRAGRVYHATVTATAPAPVVTPAPLSQSGPARPRILQVSPRGRAAANGATPVHNPTSGPVFRQATQPIRARVPQVFSRGRAYGDQGAPVIHAGPVVYPLQGARARLPQLHPRAGRAYGNAGAPVHNPSSGPAVRPLAGPVQARRPLFLLGRAESRPGAPPVHAGPSVTPLTRPAQARRPLPPRGRVYGNRGAPVQNPAPPVTTPAFALTSPVRAKLPPHLTGRAATMSLLPAPQNPSQGPAFSLPAQPAQARRPLPPRGHVHSRAGAPVSNPAPPVIATPYRLAQPVRARLPRTLTGRAITTKAVALTAPVYPQQVLTQPAGILVYLLRTGHVQASVQTSPVRNPPPPGPPFAPLTSPAGVRVIFLRTGAGAGAQPGPVQNPVNTPAPVYPLTQPVRARRPLPAPGRAATMALLPVPVTPTAGPVAYPLTSPARSRILPPPRGRAYGNRGAPVNNPAQSSGPKLYPLTQPVRARRPLPPRGRDYLPLPYKAPVNPVPSSGPPFAPLTSPAGLRVIFSRIGSGAGTPGIPVTAPAPTPAVFYPATQAVRAKPGTFSKGRTEGSKGAPVHNPVTGQGPPFYPQGTVRFRITLPPRGRGYGSKGAPVIHTGPAVRPLTSPVRAPVPQPFSKGRAAGNPGAPVHNPPSTLAPVYPQGKALHAQPAVFLKGRASGNAGAPVHNPTQGPQFRQATQPARYRIVLPPRGRVYGNIGAPIHNPVEGPVPPGTLYLTPGTIIQGQAYAATTIATGGGILTISNAEGAVTVITPAAEGYAPSSITPPPDSDIPPPDSVVVPAYVQR